MATFITRKGFRVSYARPITQAGRRPPLCLGYFMTRKGELALVACHAETKADANLALEMRAMRELPESRGPWTMGRLTHADEGTREMFFHLYDREEMCARVQGVL
jgi:hypothetical protein